MTQECKADYTGWLKYLDQLGYRKVVLCKDCIHHIDGLCEEWDYMSTDDEYWCKDGERKENE